MSNDFLSGQNVQRTFQSGNIYYGDLRNNQMNGFGIYIFANGNTLQGNFRNNIPHGVLLSTRQNLNIDLCQLFSSATDDNRVNGKFITIELRLDNKLIEAFLFSRNCESQNVENKFDNFGSYKQEAQQIYQALLLKYCTKKKDTEEMVLSTYNERIIPCSMFGDRIKQVNCYDPMQGYVNYLNNENNNSDSMSQSRALSVCNHISQGDIANIGDIEKGGDSGKKRRRSSFQDNLILQSNPVTYGLKKRSNSCGQCK